LKEWIRNRIEKIESQPRRERGWIRPLLSSGVTVSIPHFNRADGAANETGGKGHTHDRVKMRDKLRSTIKRGYELRGRKDKPDIEEKGVRYRTVPSSIVKGEEKAAIGETLHSTWNPGKMDAGTPRQSQGHERGINERGMLRKSFVWVSFECEGVQKISKVSRKQRTSHLPNCPVGGGWATALVFKVTSVKG